MNYFIIRKNVLLCFFLTVVSGAMVAQENIIITEEDTVYFDSPVVSTDTVDTVDPRGITDEMTLDPDQNADWRTGNGSYSAKPKNLWELGIHGGAFHINGDVPSGLFDGYGFGLHLRKSINYIISFRFDGIYSNSTGLDGRSSQLDVIKLDNSSAEVRDNLAKYSNGDILYRTFKTKNIGGSFHLIFNIGNVLFHRMNNNWNFYAGAGVGMMKEDVRMDYLNGTEAYDFNRIESEYGQKNTSDKRKAIKDMLDGDYESVSENDRNVPLFNDNGKLVPQFIGSIGVSRKINRRVNISLEQQFFVQDNDKWDGHENRTLFDETNDSDVGFYMNFRLGINLGSLKSRVEPLYWVNPLDGTFNDIAALKRRPQVDLSDSDQDGVIDFLDIEEATPIGAPVDTRGVTLDSDGDGLADYNDNEPFSPPGFIIDEVGVAQIKGVNGLSEIEVIEILNNNCPNCGERAVANTTTTIVETGCGEWFLPMIHFDLDKYAIKPEYYGQLRHVATVLKQCPEICVVAQGYTDARNTDSYNLVLSYNRAKASIDFLVATYGIDRSRFTLMYGGEENPLVGGINDGYNISNAEERAQYMNRRVEFRLCKANDFNMPRPDGAEAGRGSQGSSRVGSKYSGNKNSGY